MLARVGWGLTLLALSGALSACTDQQTLSQESDPSPDLRHRHCYNQMEIDWLDSPGPATPALALREMIEGQRRLFEQESGPRRAAESEAQAADRQARVTQARELLQGLEELQPATERRGKAGTVSALDAEKHMTASATFFELSAGGYRASTVTFSHLC